MLIWYKESENLLLDTDTWNIVKIVNTDVVYNQELFFRKLKENRVSMESFSLLIYLMAYANDDGYIEYDDSTDIDIKKLAQILRLPFKNTVDFIYEVENGYIVNADDGFKLKDTFDKEIFMIRKYSNEIRYLYNNTERKNRRYLGYVFALFPFISVNYNIICMNPFVEESDELEIILPTFIYEMIGWKKKETRELINIFDRITFNVNGQDEYFVSYVKNYNDIRFFVNPHIMYYGNKDGCVKVLGSLSKK